MASKGRDGDEKASHREPTSIRGVRAHPRERRPAQRGVWRLSLAWRRESRLHDHHHTDVVSPAAGSGGRTSAKYRDALAYVDCMRSHGVPRFPDPSSDGQINVDFAHGGKDGSPGSPGIDRNSPRYISADQTCRHLLPGGVPTPAQNQQALANGLKLAKCMRSHGVPNYPDPNPSDPGVVHLKGVDPSSPQFQTAQKACESVVPGYGSK